MWRGLLAAVLLAVAGCNTSPYPGTTQPTTTPPTKSTAKPEGATPANTMKEPGHIPGG